MKTALVFLLTLSLQQSPAKVDGEWSAILGLPLGDTPFTMLLVQKGSALSGYMLNEFGQFDLKGSVEKDQVQFEWDFPDRGRIVTIHFTGKIDRNTISGVAKVGDVGEGTMTAQRK